MACAPVTCTVGSSPLTRGAQSLEMPSSEIMRIIPAHAGSTSVSMVAIGLIPDHPRSRGEHTKTLVTNRDGLWDHPRSRGEHPTRLAKPTQDLGSSPLTRGAPPVPVLPVACFGIIPAHAGSTLRIVS